ncbi:MAG: hypothetical protein ACOWWR_18310 [Eubacteriales bacterium]
MSSKFDGMSKDEIIDAIAKEMDFLPEELKETMILAAFHQMLQ